MPAISIDQALQMAKTLFRAGRLAEAEATYRQILATVPESAEAWLQLSDVYARQGRMDEATTCRERAIQTQSHSVGDTVVLGNNLMEQGRFKEAIMAFEQALKLDPERPEVHYNLGNTHARAGAWEQAVACYRRALALRPDYQKANTNLGCVLLEQHRMEEAIAFFQAQPETPEKHCNLGIAFSRDGQPRKSIAAFQQALALRPDDAQTCLALASELLLAGRFEEGWRMHTRYRARTPPTEKQRQFHVPRWDGSPIPQQTILIYEDQGIGDAIQFLRYLPLLRARSGNARLLLECPAPLSRLIRQSGGLGDEVIDRGDPMALALRRFDWRIAFSDLPFALQQWPPVSMDAPYLRPDTRGRDLWRTRLGARRRTRVGLAWAGNPRHRNDIRRSLPSGQLLSLLQTIDADFYTLQFQPEGGQPRPLLEAGLIDLTGSIVDLADTAALITELDLVISVDTAVAHLAGALGHPVWTLLPFVPEWRWGLEREDTPWYPAMRLFRQPALGNWEAVIRRVGEELSALTVEAKKRFS